MLLLGTASGDQWLALMLTSKDHDRDAAEEERCGRDWMDVGSGGWDREGRPSEVRLDRLLVLDDSAIRREGAALDRGDLRRRGRGGPGAPRPALTRRLRCRSCP